MRFSVYLEIILNKKLLFSYRCNYIITARMLRWLGSINAPSKNFENNGGISWHLVYILIKYWLKTFLKIYIFFYKSARPGKTRAQRQEILYSLGIMLIPWKNLWKNVSLPPPLKNISIPLNKLNFKTTGKFPTPPKKSQTPPKTTPPLPPPETI